MKKVNQLLQLCLKHYRDAENKFLNIPLNKKLDVHINQLRLGMQTCIYFCQNCHAWKKFWNYTLDFTKGLFGALFLMHFFTIYQDKGWHGFTKFIDQSVYFFFVSNNLEKRMPYAFDSILEQSIKQGKQDANVWISIGQIYAQGQEPEFSYSAYYIAHLKEHKKIRANSDIPFETIAKITPGQKKNPLAGVSGGRDINQMLETISN